MADPNITKVYLLSVPLENDYKHTLYFESASAQYSYFYGKRVSGCQFTDFSYQRKDSIIRVPLHYDTLVSKGVNYVMYQNAAYSTDRWFYAFITDMQYVTDNRTDITIETDVMQTWMFDIDVKASFVEREHCADDTIGLHTYPEGLETGEYICNSRGKDTALDDLEIVIGYTATANGDLVLGTEYGGIYSGVKYSSALGHTEMYEFISAFQSGRESAIQCLFMAPSFLCEHNPEDTYQIKSIIASDKPKTYSITQQKNFDLGGYEGVKNNKLKCYPYNYMLLSNNCGGAAVLQYELFSTDKATFEVQGVITPGCSIRIIPKNYGGLEYNDECGLNLGKYPICNWTSDMYTNWLTQNSVNFAVSAIQTVGSVGLAMTGNPIAAAYGVVSGVNSIAGTIAQVYEHSLQPSQANGNLNCGDVITSSGKNAFHFYKMSVKKEYAEIIDNYFTMFGYKTCLVKVPETNHRPYFWYTKTIDVSIDGTIPNKDMQKIKDCYNNGITFWKSGSVIGDYSVDNSIN